MVPLLWIARSFGAIEPRSHVRVDQGGRGSARKGKRDDAARVVIGADDVSRGIHREPVRTRVWNRLADRARGCDLQNVAGDRRRVGVRHLGDVEGVSNPDGPFDVAEAVAALVDVRVRDRNAGHAGGFQAGWGGIRERPARADVRSEAAAAPCGAAGAGPTSSTPAGSGSTCPAAARPAPAGSGSTRPAAARPAAARPATAVPLPPDPLPPVAVPPVPLPPVPLPPVSGRSARGGTAAWSRCRRWRFGHRFRSRRCCLRRRQREGERRERTLSEEMRGPISCRECYHGDRLPTDARRLSTVVCAAPRGRPVTENPVPHRRTRRRGQYGMPGIDIGSLKTPLAGEFPITVM